MLKLENLFCLSSRVAVYVPATCGVDVAADTSAWVDKVAAALSDYFGGATCSPCLGCWVSPVAGLVKENTTMVFAFCSDVDLQTRVGDLLALCEDMKNQLKQEAVAIEINGSMYFV